jgi:hypothetical protein
MTLIIQKPTGAKLNLAKTFTWNETVWNPSMISTALWLDAADASTVTTVSGNVSQWNDKSGNSRNVSQATLEQRPTYTAGLLNGLPGIDWGSTNNTKGLSIASGLVAAQIFAVADYDGTDPFQQFSALFTADPSVLYRPVFTSSSGSNWLSNVQNHLNGSSTSSATALPTISSPFIVRNAAGNTSSTTRTVVYIGADTLFEPSRSWRGKIYEVIVIPSFLSLLETQKVEGYLAHKWGLTANLPGDHPYKTVGPTP